MKVAYEDNVRPWLDIVDNLRRVGIEQEIGIPQIAGAPPKRAQYLPVRLL